MAAQVQDGTSVQVDHDAFRVIIIGDYGVGKTSILLRFIKDVFYSNPVAEAGYISDFVKEVDLKGKLIKLHIWDTAGLERHTVLTDQYYAKADAVIMVYDCCDQKSYSSIDKWYSEMRRNLADKLDDNMPVIMVANKKDKLKEAMKEATTKYIDFKIAQKKATTLGYTCIGTSAKSGENIQKLFKMVAEALSDKDCPKVPDTVDLVAGNRKKSCSC
ncbi:ras-related protein Rab-1D-like [Dysidea avara]|uniref:ras-related protein Rab-1D-like n=1 Tax=Dysidea avara TaxID=196820 RepID=UPI00332ED9E7